MAVKKQPKVRKVTTRRGGRPRNEIDLEKLERLCRVQTPDAEIAGYFGVSLRTVARLKLKEPYAAIFHGGVARGKVAIRSAQFDCGLKGNSQMLIHLGKMYLGQREEIDINQAVAGNVSGRIEVTYVDKGKSEDDQSE